MFISLVRSNSLANLAQNIFVMAQNDKKNLANEVNFLPEDYNFDMQAKFALLVRGAQNGSSSPKW